MTYWFHGYRLDVDSRELSIDGATIATRSNVFDCLVYLVQHRNRAIGRDELAAAVWGRADISDAQLSQCILRVRRAVNDDGGSQKFVRTIPKFGYQWVAEIAPEGGGLDLPSGPSETAVSNRPPRESAIRMAQARSRVWFRLGAGVVLVALIVIGVHGLWTDGVDRRASRAQVVPLLVLPIRVDAGEDFAWARLGAMDLIARRLRSAGLPVPTSESTLSLLHKQKLDERSGASDASLREASGADLLITGRLAHTPEGWRAELIASKARGQPLHAIATADEMLGAARNAADALLRQLGKVPPQRGNGNAALDEVLHRAEAAMLANELDTARKILLDAPELVRNEPQLRDRLAQIDFRAGRFAQIVANLNELLTSETATTDAFLHGHILIGLGSVDLSTNDAVAAERHFGAAVESLRDWNHPLEYGQALTGLGAAKGLQGRYADALVELGQARIQLDQAGDRVAAARVDMVQGLLELMRHRYEPARLLLEASERVFKTYGVVNEYVYTLSLQASGRLAMLDPQGALAPVDEAWAFEARLLDPHLRAGLYATRVAVMLASGRLNEAETLLKRMGEQAAEVNSDDLGASDYDIAIAERFRAELAWTRGHKQQSIAHAGRALQLLPPTEDEARMQMVLLRQRALLSLDRRQEARELFAALAPRDTTANPLGQVTYLVARAELELAEGGLPRAEPSFRAALEAAESGSAPADIALVVESWVQASLDAGDPAQAAAIAGRIAPWAERDYRCALLLVRLQHTLGNAAAGSRALDHARALAGERVIPTELEHLP